MLASYLAGPFIGPRIGQIQLHDTINKTGIIAIVDDDGPLLEALGSVLKAAGFLVETFPSAEAFLDSCRRGNIMCLILDVRLPGISGIELQRKLLDAGNPVPIIFVTAHADASVRDLVIRAGAAGFLNKPVRSDTLLKEIHWAIEKTSNNKHS